MDSIPNEVANPHLASRFFGVVLGPTMILKMVSEFPPRFVGPPPRFVGPPDIRFSLSGHPPFMSTLQMSNPRRGRCVKEPYIG